jgi:hypothetical protein
MPTEISGSTGVNKIQDGTVVAADLASGAVADNTPSFGVKLSSNQSISDQSNTKISWDTEEWDTDSVFASGKFTVPSGKAGKYHFSGTVVVRNIDDGEIASLRIHLNGSDSASGLNHYRFNYQGAATDTMTFLPISVVMNLAVGDYVELFLYHNEGSAQNVDAGYSRWAGHKLAGV